MPEAKEMFGQMHKITDRYLSKMSIGNENQSANIEANKRGLLEMQVSFFNWIVSVSPIVMLIILMSFFHWSATKAAAVTMMTAALTSVAFFGADSELIIFEALKGGWNAVTVLYIIFPAILLYEVIENAGCIEAINDGVGKISPNELFKILSVGWVFAGFLQGITGFGVPVAICVPILIGFGVRPVMAVVISLLGQSWGNTFGTLAVAWDVLIDISGIGGDESLKTAFYASLLLWLINVCVGTAICWMYGKLEGIKKGAVFVVLISLIHGGGELLVSQVNTSVAAFVPTTAALLALLIIARLKIYRKEWYLKESPIMTEERNLSGSSRGSESVGKIAFAPYGILIAVTVVLLVIPPVNDFLGQVSVGFAFPKTETSMGYVNEAAAKYSPFYPFVDSGTVLLITCIISFLILRKYGLIKRGALKDVMKRAVSKTKPSASSVLLLLIISKIMSGSGQTMIIAQGITEAVGDKYAFVAAFIGLIGSFITGSNMSSNILFTDVQMGAAGSLGVNAGPLLAAQTAGAAAGSVISPNKIVLGTTSAGEPGKEGEILKILLVPTMILTLIIGVICRILI